MRQTLLAVLLATAAVAAQNGPEFDVASVRPAAPGRPLSDYFRRAAPGQWRNTNITLQNAVMLAYPAFRMPGLIAGGPAWMREDRFDFEARTSPTATQADVDAMARRLLQDRFALRAHVEQRPLDVYTLVVAKPGTLGPGLTPAAAPCVTWRMSGGAVPADCDLYRKTGGAGLTIAAGTIADLITALTLHSAVSSGIVQSAIDRPVVDRTGLTGFFQIVGPSGLAAASPGGTDASFFTLLEEQLGLRLVPSREVVDVLVIDSVTKPDPN